MDICFSLESFSTVVERKHDEESSNKTEAVTFMAAGVELGGIFVLLTFNGPHPAWVLLHGLDRSGD
jgi:hypothetical protein